MPVVNRSVSWRWLAALVLIMNAGLAIEATAQIPATRVGPDTQSIGDGNQANKITVLAVVNGEAINILVRRRIPLCAVGPDFVVEARPPEQRPAAIHCHHGWLEVGVATG